MRLEDFNYDLPKKLIAQKPISPRDRSRLLVIRRGTTNSAHPNENKRTGEMEHKHFYDIVNYLQAGDVLVLNNTKVMPARLIGKKAETGGRVEIFLLKKDNFVLSSRPCASQGRDPLNVVYKTSKRFLANARNDNSDEVWQCLVGGKKRKENLQVEFAGGLKAKIVKNNYDGTWEVKFNKSGAAFMKIVERIGRVPLPPYIKRDSIASLQNDKDKYQTIYADETKLGSVAAPTAGFHFTKKLISRLKRKGVQFEYVTLQVGLGTFAPVKTDDITKHKMHAEYVEADKNTIERIMQAKLEGRRVIAVGTTSARALESLFKNYSRTCHGEEPVCRQAGVRQFHASVIPGLTRDLWVSSLNAFLDCGSEAAMTRKKIASLSSVARNDKNYSGWTDIYIYPGYNFKVVDALITNFHLPKSTLLMLVSAYAKAPADKSVLAGRNKIFKAYRSAIKKKYRFYSYGDAMLII